MRKQLFLSNRRRIRSVLARAPVPVQERKLLAKSLYSCQDMTSPVFAMIKDESGYETQIIKVIIKKSLLGKR